MVAVNLRARPDVLRSAGAELRDLDEGKRTAMRVVERSGTLRAGPGRRRREPERPGPADARGIGSRSTRRARSAIAARTASARTCLPETSRLPGGPGVSGHRRASPSGDPGAGPGQSADPRHAAPPIALRFSPDGLLAFTDSPAGADRRLPCPATDLRVWVPGEATAGQLDDAPSLSISGRSLAWRVPATDGEVRPATSW